MVMCFDWSFFFFFFFFFLILVIGDAIFFLWLQVLVS